MDAGVRAGLTRWPECEEDLRDARPLHFLDEVPVRIVSNGVMVHRLVARGSLSAHTEVAVEYVGNSDWINPHQVGCSAGVRAYCPTRVSAYGSTIRCGDGEHSHACGSSVVR